MPKPELSKTFTPATYLLQKNGDLLHLSLAGQKQGPPSHRISLNQSGLKITGAKVTRYDKHGATDIDITRINHLPSVEQVRLHSQTVMYPGRYQIEIDYRLKRGDYNPENPPNRKTMPSIDEPIAWQSAKFEFKP